jgi:serine/threonine-protein kinase
LTNFRNDGENGAVHSSIVGNAMFCPACAAPVGRRSDVCARCGVPYPTGMWGPLEKGETVAQAPAEEPGLEGLLLEGKYVVERRLARGGMGEVYRGRDSKLDRPVAIKFLSERLLSDREIVRRFLREAQSAAKLRHPNIVTVYSVGEEQGRPYFVMELVEGHTLLEVIQSHKRLPLPQSLDFAAQICEALAHIHARGYVHRDIKSQNVMVDDTGRCTILDFGILKVVESDHTRTGSLAGTPHYISPEQARDSKNVDARSDLYSLGIVLFEMLSGRLPFREGSVTDILLQHIATAPPRIAEFAPEMPSEIDAVLHKLLAKSPDDRFPSAIAAREALNAVPLSRRPSTAKFVPMAPSESMIPTAKDQRAISQSMLRLDSRTPSEIPASRVVGEGLGTAPAFRRPRRAIWLGAGGVALAAGAILWLTLREPSSPPRSTAQPVAAATGTPAAPLPTPRPTAQPSAPAAPLPAALAPTIAAAPAPSPTAAPAPTAEPEAEESDESSARPSKRKKLARKLAPTEPAPEAPTGSTSTVVTPPPPKPEPQKPPEVPADTPARVTIESDPPGARITADGEVIGRTPLEGYSFAPGIRRITVTKDGHGPWKKTIAFKPGESRQLIATLTAVPATLVVKVLQAGEVSWANVSLDGKELGAVNIRRFSLKAGEHSLVAKRIGYRTVRRTVSLTAGKNETARIDLEEAK